MRVGFGYDVHAFSENRKLILGGVEIPFEKGLLGHSDADVLVHAMNDALLGAAALRDIGYHFPDTDMKYKDIDSLILMAKVRDLLTEKGYRIENIDATVVAEEPKIKNVVPEMVKNIARTLRIQEDQVNIKGTTTEKTGISGAKRRNCILCHLFYNKSIAILLFPC